MLEFVKKNKYKVIGLVIAALLIIGATVLYYSATIEARECVENGGKIVYDSETNTVTCKNLSTKPWTEEFWERMNDW